MNRKKIISVILTLILFLACVCACQAANPSRTDGGETSAEQANNAYQNDVAILDTMGGTSTSVNAGSFGCTTRNADGVFYITSHVDNTYMYGKTSSDQASAMKELFEFFDYK